MLYNTGFIVKNVYFDDIMGLRKSITECDSWPLKHISEYDFLDQEVEKRCLYSESGYFLNPRYCDRGWARSVNIVDDFSFVQEYIEECKKLSVPAVALMVESEISIRNSPVIRKDFVSLGWDCMATDYESFLEDIAEGCPELYSFKTKLNAFGLFDDYSTANEYMILREQLIPKYRPDFFETAFEPIVCKYSLWTGE